MRHTWVMRLGLAVWCLWIPGAVLLHSGEAAAQEATDATAAIGPCDDPDLPPTYRPTRGPFVRFSAHGLTTYLGDPTYADADRRAIGALAFGGGLAFGVQFDSTFSLSIFGDVLLGGVDTQVLEGFADLQNVGSARGSVGLAGRFALGHPDHWRPVLGIEGALMRQWVWWDSEETTNVTLIDRFGRPVGTVARPTTSVRSQHDGWGVGPTLGLEKRTGPDGLGPTFFIEAVAQYQRWSPDGAELDRAYDPAAADAAAAAVQGLQQEAQVWSGTLRIGLQFGP